MLPKHINRQLSKSTGSRETAEASPDHGVKQLLGCQKQKRFPANTIEIKAQELLVFESLSMQFVPSQKISKDSVMYQRLRIFECPLATDILADVCTPE